MNTRALIRATTLGLLQNPHGRTWQVQGLGMLRTYLTPEIRLHIWDKKLRVPNVSAIHDHPWNFRSYVVSGRLRQMRYEECDPRALDSVGAKLYGKQLIQCGPQGSPMGNPTQVYLRPVKVTMTPFGELEQYVAGEWYEQRAEEIHESIPDDGTVTLVERHFREDTEHAKVYFTTPEWVSALPRSAMGAEVMDVVERALAGWDA